MKNPTQGGSAEQQHFQQYSVYNYQNRKIEGLWRLYRATGNSLFLDLMNRALQNIYFTQETEGGNKGGTYERIADPWLVREETSGGPHFDSMGSNYTNEQALDCFLQVMELFRMGREIYQGSDLINYIFPDGECIYSRDISDVSTVPLQVMPSGGKLSLQVDHWTEALKSWRVSASNPSISINQRVGRLIPHERYAVKVDGEPVGTYYANSTGEILFSISGNFEDQSSVLVSREAADLSAP